jgi:hypothetical protein
MITVGNENASELYNNEVGVETISEIVHNPLSTILQIFNRHVTNTEHVAVSVCSSVTAFNSSFSIEQMQLAAGSLAGWTPSNNVPIGRNNILFDVSVEKEMYIEPDDSWRVLKHGFDFDYKKIGNDWYRLAFDESLQDRDTGECITFRQLFNSDVEVKFSDGYFLVAVFKYNTVNRVFNLVESYLLNYDVNKKIGNVSYGQVQRAINETSPNIWLSINSGLALDDEEIVSACLTNSTNNETILNTVIRNDYPTKQSALRYEMLTAETNAAFEDLRVRFSDPSYYPNLRYFLPVVRKNNDGSLNLDFASDLVNARKNCTTFMTIWDETTPKLMRNDSDKINYVLGELGTGTRTGTAFRSKNSYTMCYDNMKYQVDEFNNTNRWIPLAGDIAGIVDAFDKTYNAYDVPAGYATKRIQNIIKMLYDLKDSKLKDKLASNSVNIINKDESGQWMLFDMQTNVSGGTAFRKMNVRRVVIECKRIVSELAKTIFFATNDSTTRVGIVRDLQSSLRSIGGLESFRVICDDSNNTDADESQGTINIDLMLVPVGYVRVINLKIYLTKNSLGGITEQEI